MASRKCVFISTDLHDTLISHISDRNPKVTIGSWVENIVKAQIKAEVAFRGVEPLSIEDILIWKKAYEDANMPPTNQRY